MFRLTAIAALMSGSTAMAGGFVPPVVETPIEITEVAPVPAWEGMYVGGTLGYGFGGDDKVGTTVNGFNRGNMGDLEISGGNYGLHAGYRWQRPVKDKYQWVFAGELGYEAGGLGDDVDSVMDIMGSSMDGTASVDVNSVLALRVKSGVLNQAGDTWFYGIAGVGMIDYDYAIALNNASTRYSTSYDGESATGYILGLGVEHKFDEKWSVTGEWEYQNYGKETIGDKNSGISTEATPDWHQIKIGLNYQF
ncbi:MAG: outer membrane protein [Paracoccus sp. (in: a-proteobacteria)]